MKTIFKTIFGSHLYGTNTEKSDKDYKGIYIEPIENIILKRDKDVIVSTTKKDKSEGVRNTAEDVDIEMKELRRFLYDAKSGQTYALDMLFSNEDLWIEFSKEWRFIVDNRHKLLSKNVQPYVGYIRQQTGKYGLKGSRLGELLRVIEYLKGFDIKRPLYSVMNGLNFSEFVQKVEIENPRPHGETPIVSEFLDVLGKKFQLNRSLEHVLPSLEKMNEMYGQRSILAMKNEGVDWKAVSHAFRCCYQLIELAETQNITFPLKEAAYIKKIKCGEIPYVELQEKLSNLMEEAIAKVEKSDLPQYPDNAFWEDFVLSIYAPKRIKTLFN